MRINARLDSESSKKLEYLLTTTHAQVTEVIKCSLDLYYKKVSQNEIKKNKQLLQSDFIGCAESDPSLSSEYKTLLTRSLADKHGNS